MGPHLAKVVASVVVDEAVKMQGNVFINILFFI